MTSLFFPAPVRVRNAPRTAEPLESLKLRVPASLKLAMTREAASAGVSVSYYWREGIRRFVDATHNEREKGLAPVPCLMDAEDLEALNAAAARAGLSLTTWVGHVLLDAASSEPAVDDTSEGIVA